MARSNRYTGKWRPRVEVLEDRRLLATFTVTSLSDPGNGVCDATCTLREAITAANNASGADMITFSQAGTGTIQLDSALPVISTPMTIQEGDHGRITIQGEGVAGGYRIFDVADAVASPAISVTFDGLIIKDGVSNQGGGIRNEENLTIRDSRISNNEVRGEEMELHEGGGIYNEANGILTVSHSDILNNTVCPETTDPDPPSCPDPTGAQLRYSGGGIFSKGQLTVEFSTVANNGVFVQDAVGTTGYKSQGGGINMEGSLLVVHSSTINANTAKIISGNAESARHNSGGGIWSGTETEIINCTITGNTTSNNADYEPEVPQQVNFISGGGAGITFHTPSSTFVGWSTIANNTTEVFEAGTGRWAGGGGIFQDLWSGGQPLIELRNTIVANNQERRGTGQNLVISDIDACKKDDVDEVICEDSPPAGGVDDDGFNLYRSSGSITDCNGCEDDNLANPNLGALQDNGGLTHTRALQTGSPAIDAGDNTDAPDYDQRGPGFARVVGGTIDLGAFEVQAEEAPVAPPLDMAVLITADDQPLFGKVKRRR